jgi:hypothetical protein
VKQDEGLYTEGRGVHSNRKSKHMVLHLCSMAENGRDRQHLCAEKGVADSGRAGSGMVGSGSKRKARGGMEWIDSVCWASEEDG